MNTINRNYYPAPGLSASAVNPAPESTALPPGFGIGQKSHAIDFSSPQQKAEMNAAPGSLRAAAQLTQTNACSSAPQGADGALTLNKLVEAIRSVLKELISLLRGDQQQQPPSAPQSSAQPHGGNAPANPQPSIAGSTPTTSSPSTSHSVPPPAAEKPFVVRDDPSTDHSVTMQKKPTATPTAAPDPTSIPTHKARTKEDETKPPQVSDPVVPAIKHSTPDQTPTAPEKAANPVTRSAHPNGDGVDMSGMVGFAKTSNTTGGNGGEVVTVNTVEELQKSLADDKARTIRLGADLSAGSKVTVKFGANKTLLGTEEGNGLHNIYLANDKGASNDIFQNLNFSHDSRYRENNDMQMYINSGERYWLDHNTFSGTKDQNPTGLDKLLYVGGTADNVSLTNSKFQNNEYGVILGQPDDSAQAKAAYKGYPHMTIANNLFNNLDVRAPGLMRHGNFDVYNNLVDDFHLGFTATGDATILSQANYFQKGVDTANNPSNQGVLDDKGDAHFRDVGSNVSFTQKSPTTAWTPPYQRDVKTAEEAKAYNLVNAGARTGN